MHPSQKMPNSISSIPISSIPSSSILDEPALPPLTKRAKDFIAERLQRGEPPEWVAAGLRAYFEIEITPAQVIPWLRGEIPPATQTERRQDKESTQFPADEEREPLFTRMSEVETQAAASTPSHSEQSAVAAPEEDASATQTTRTEPGQNAESLQIPADTRDAPTGRDKALDALADLARAKLGIAPESAGATQTGRRQNEKNPSVLTDEVKAFIVRGLARYETPTQVAAAVQANFDIEITRRQVFAYDPAGSRPPAQRWIDLHAATRAKFMQASAEIGVAQKLVRLRMLDRFANRADEQNYTERAAKFLAQAAKECGGFYERYQRPKGGAVGA